MSKDQIAVRRDIEWYLFIIGLSIQEVARVMDINSGSVRNDYDYLGGREAFPQSNLSLAEQKNQAYANCLLLYSQLIFGKLQGKFALRLEGKSEEMKSELRLALEEYLDIHRMRNVADGLVSMVNLLCRPIDPIEYRSHRALLNAIFGPPKALSAQDFLLSYLWQISVHNIIPERKTLAESMGRWAIEEYQECFNVPLDNEVVRAVDSVLDTLTPRQREVLCMRFGIGGEQMTLSQIAEHYNVSQARVRQIEARALAKLRHPVRSGKLRCFVSSQRGAREYLQDTFPAPVIIKTPEVPPDNLSKSVEELEVSVRLYNCLKNLGVRYVYELVQKTEHELLLSRSFRRRALNELKELLASMDLSLGMKI